MITVTLPFITKNPLNGAQGRSWTRLTDEEVQTILKGVMDAGINAPGQSLAFRMKIDWLRARLAEVNP